MSDSSPDESQLGSTNESSNEGEGAEEEGTGSFGFTGKFSASIGSSEESQCREGACKRNLERSVEDIERKQRILAKRRSAAASRQRRLDLIAELQEALAGLSRTVAILTSENMELRHQLELHTHGMGVKGVTETCLSSRDGVNDPEIHSFLRTNFVGTGDDTVSQTGATPNISSSGQNTNFSEKIHLGMSSVFCDGNLAHVPQSSVSTEEPHRIAI